MNKQQMWENAFEKINEKYITDSAAFAPDGKAKDNAAPDLRGTVKKGHGGNILFVIAAAAAVLGCIVGVNHFLGDGKEISVQPAGTTTNEAIPPITTATDEADTTYKPVIGREMTIADVAALIQTGKTLTWADFEPFEGEPVRADHGYGFVYNISEEYRLSVMGEPDSDPQYVSFIHDKGNFEQYYDFYSNELKDLLTEKFGYKFEETQAPILTEEQESDKIPAENIEYQLENGVLTIADGTTEIYANSFKGNNEIYEVIIPDSVTRISDYAFAESSVVKITIPDNVEYIGEYAFYMSKLEEIYLPDSVEEIGEGAFERTNLNSIRLPAKLKTISNRMIYNVIPLISIEIPESVEVIGDLALGRTSLTSVTIPDSVEKINAWAFYGCSILKTVDFSENSNLKKIGDYAFGCCARLESISLPDSLVYIGPIAFEQHTQVTFKNTTYNGQETNLYTHINYGSTDEEEPAPDLLLGAVVDKPDEVTTYFGYDEWRGGSHEGIDYGWEGCHGANIYAAADGTVVVVQNDFEAAGTLSVGNYVIIDHGDGYQTLYYHCSNVLVKEGQKVGKGDIIALIGATGWVTGPSLHFELQRGGMAIDPTPYFGKEQVTVVENKQNP